MDHECRFEERIIQLCEDVATIKAQTKDKVQWKIILLTLIVTVILQAVSFAFWLGGLSETINKLEEVCYAEEAK